jgi:hypothetical protein
MKKYILQEIEEQLYRVECRNAELFNWLQNGTQNRKGEETDQSTCGRMEIGTACKEENSMMKNLSIESPGGDKNL